MTMTAFGIDLQHSATPRLQTFNNLARNAAQIDRISETSLREMIAQFLKLSRRKEEVYGRLLKLPQLQAAQFANVLHQLEQCLFKLKEARLTQKSFSLVDRKTLSYHFCAKLVQMFDNFKERQKSDRSEQFERNKQEVMKTYRRMLEDGQFDVVKLVECISQNEQRPPEKALTMRQQKESIEWKPLNQTTLIESSENVQTRFLNSMQTASDKQRDHLMKFMENKQKARAKKAKIEQKNRNQLKVTRQKIKEIYAPMRLEDVLKGDFCLSICKQQNVKMLMMKQMERNNITANTIKGFTEEHKTYRAKSQYRRFRIRRKAKDDTTQPQKMGDDVLISKHGSVPACQQFT